MLPVDKSTISVTVKDVSFFPSNHRLNKSVPGALLVGVLPQPTEFQTNWSCTEDVWDDSSSVQNVRLRQYSLGFICMYSLRIFFQFWPFYNYFFKNELGQKFFLNLTILSHASPVGMTYEVVMSVHVVWLMALARAQSVTWCHVGVSRAGSCGATAESRRLLWCGWWPCQLAPRVHQLHQSRRRDSVAPYHLARLVITWTGARILPPLTLSLISHTLSLCLSLSLSREDLLAPVSSPPPPGSVEPPFVTTAGRRPHRRLLSTSNRVDLSLT
jgi:hypothetical protein